MAKKSEKQKLESLKSGKELINYVEKKGATVRRGKGSHVVVEYKGSQTVIPDHGNKDLARGTRLKILKWIISVGLALLAIFWIVQNLPLTP